MRIVRLVKQAKKGDKEALLALISEQQDAYYRLAYAYMGNSHDAMDVVEDMIVILYQSMHQLKKEASFYSWSKTILVNRCKRVLQQQKRLLVLEQIDETTAHLNESHSITDPIVTSEQRMDTSAMLSVLTETQRESIELHYFHDLDLQTIADSTQVSIGTVKSRIFQGLKKMREKFGGDWNE